MNAQEAAKNSRGLTTMATLHAIPSGQHIGRDRLSLPPSTSRMTNQLEKYILTTGNTSYNSDSAVDGSSLGITSTVPNDTPRADCGRCTIKDDEADDSTCPTTGHRKKALKSYIQSSLYLECHVSFNSDAAINGESPRASKSCTQLAVKSDPSQTTTRNDTPSAIAYYDTDPTDPAWIHRSDVSDERKDTNEDLFNRLCDEFSVLSVNSQKWDSPRLQPIIYATVSHKPNLKPSITKRVSSKRYHLLSSDKPTLVPVDDELKEMDSRMTVLCLQCSVARRKTKKRLKQSSETLRQKLNRKARLRQKGDRTVNQD